MTNNEMVELVKKIILNIQDIAANKILLKELYISLINSNEFQKLEIGKIKLSSGEDMSDTEHTFFLEQTNVKQLQNISQFLDFDKDIIGSFVSTIFHLQFCWFDDVLPTSHEINMELQQDISSICEKFTQWFEQHDHLSFNLLSGYKQAIADASSAPTVRKQVILSLFRWIKALAIRTSVIVPFKCYNVLRDTILIGLTDVWSAIRKDTSSRLSVVLDILSEEKFQDFFQHLIQICKTGKIHTHKNEMWQVTEGGIRGIDKILRSCKYIPTSHMTKDTSNTPSVSIKIGTNMYEELPLFITKDMEKILFTLFAHQQYSIRELAGKTFAVFLNKLDYSSLMDSFEKVMHHLRPESDDTFMNAYEAEGFINAALFLIKNVPLTYLLGKWVEIWSTLTHYLSHPASTVRQTTSTIFKYIVSKDLTSTLLIELVIQSLCSGWKTNIEILISNNSPADNILQPQQFSQKDLSNRWEWMEGIFFVYELILKFLLTNNHYFSSTTSRRKTKHTQSSNLHNSIAEGQLRSALKKQNTLRNDLLTRSSIGRHKLTKSFTQNLPNIKDIKPSRFNHGFQSLLSVLKKEESEKESFLTEEIPTLDLHKFSVFTSTLLNTQNITKEWFQEITKLNLVSFRQLLKQILLQSIESLHHQRWELRRMARQILPNVCDVILHFDNSILEDLTRLAFQYRGSLLHYGSNLCLLHIVKLYVKYRKLTNESLTPSKSECICDITVHLDTLFTSLLPHLTEDINTGCKRTEISNLAALVLLHYQVHFKRKVDVDEMLCRYLNCLADEERKPEEDCEIKDYVHLLSESQQLLLDYCSKGDAKQMLCLVPVLLFTSRVAVDEALDKQLLFNCVEVVLKQYMNMDERNMDERNEVSDDSFSRYLKSSCQQVIKIFENNDIDNGKFLQLGSVVCHLQEGLRDEFPFETIMNTLESKIPKLTATINDSQKCNPNVCVDNREDRLSYSTSSFDSLGFASATNSSSSENEGLSDDEEEDADDDDESSDWDWSSSDENEKDHPTLSHLYMELQQKLTARQQTQNV